MASVIEIAEQLHRLVKAGLVKPVSADPMVYVSALTRFDAGLLEQAVTNFLQGLYRDHSSVFYPTAPQLADYCRRVQQQRYDDSYGERFDQRVRESRAAHAAREKMLADRTPEEKARVQALADSVKGERRHVDELEARIRSSMVRELSGMTPEALAAIPEAKGAR